MSMIGNLARISGETLAIVHADPTLVTSLLYPDFPTSSSSQPSFLARLFGRSPPQKQMTIASIPSVPETDTLRRP
ncbi:MAG: hypothetical protein ACC645_18505, partial [Pirellulales bacterium]